jgi:hypothetical protein
MRRYAIILPLALAFAAAHASSTLRVGSHVLVAGDSIERAVELLGKPTSHAHHRAGGGSRRRGRGRSRASSGAVTPASEQWHFRHEGHSTVLTVVDGRIVDIEDRGH